MNGNGMARRLDRLESLIVNDDEPTDAQTERDARWDQLIYELFGTMSPAHVEFLNEACADASERGERLAAGPARLLEVVLELVRAALGGRTNFKLSLPGVVAEVYLQGRGHAFGQCRECGLVLPFEGEHWRGRDHVPEWLPFDRCPECGGSIGCWDKWMNGPTLSTPAQKRAAGW